MSRRCYQLTPQVSSREGNTTFNNPLRKTTKDEAYLKMTTVITVFISKETGFTLYHCLYIPVQVDFASP